MNYPTSFVAGRKPRFAPQAQARLEQVVIDIFSRADFHNISIRDVARQAKVSLHTIYQHYGSKEGLLFHMVDKRLSVLTCIMSDHLRGMEDIKEKLRKVFWLQLDYYECNPDVGRIIWMTVPLKTWMADPTFAQKKMIGIFMEVLRQGQQEGILNSEVPAGMLLDVLHGLVQRTFFMWIYRGQKESLTKQANILFELLWRAIVDPDRRVQASETDGH